MLVNFVLAINLPLMNIDTNFQKLFRKTFLSLESPLIFSKIFFSSLKYALKSICNFAVSAVQSLRIFFKFFNVLIHYLLEDHRLETRKYDLERICFSPRLFVLNFTFLVQCFLTIFFFIFASVLSFLSQNFGENLFFEISISFNTLEIFQPFYTIVATNFMIKNFIALKTQILD